MKIEAPSLPSKASIKRAERRKQFQCIGQAISSLKQGDPDVPDYTTGKPSHFLPRSGASSDPRRDKVPGGPMFKTPQWMRTTK